MQLIVDYSLDIGKTSSSRNISSWTCPRSTNSWHHVDKYKHNISSVLTFSNLMGCIKIAGHTAFDLYDGQQYNIQLTTSVAFYISNLNKYGRYLNIHQADFMHENCYTIIVFFDLLDGGIKVTQSFTRLYGIAYMNYFN